MRTWTSWHRRVTLAILAMAFLAVSTAAERDRSPTPPTLIPLTLNEFRRLFDTLILIVTTSLEHTITWSTWRRKHQATARHHHYRHRSQHPRTQTTTAVLGGVRFGDGIDSFQQRIFGLCGSADLRQAFLYRTVAGAVVAAACDILARQVGIPLWQWLGGRPVDSIPLYANINRPAGRRRPEDFARVALEAVAAGFDTVKMAPFDGPMPDGTGVMAGGLDIVTAVREAVGPEVTILVDVHQRLGSAEVIAAIGPLGDLRIGWLEDAVDAADLGALQRLRDRTAIPLAGGELLVDLDEFVRVADSGLLDYLLLDPKYVGGPVRAREILKHLSGTRVTFHNPVGPIATAMCAHLSTLDERPPLVEFPFGEAIDRDALTDGQESVAAGRLIVPTGAGLGVTVPLRGAVG